MSCTESTQVPTLSQTDHLISPQVLFTDPVCGPGYNSEIPYRLMARGTLSSFQFEGRTWLNFGTSFGPAGPNFVSDRAKQRLLPFVAINVIHSDKKVWVAAGADGIWVGARDNEWQFVRVIENHALDLTRTTDGRLLVGTPNGIEMYQTAGTESILLDKVASAYPVWRVRYLEGMWGAAACGQFGLQVAADTAPWLQNWRWISSDQLQLTRRSISDLFWWSGRQGLELILAAGGDGWWHGKMADLSQVEKATTVRQYRPNIPGSATMRVRRLSTYRNDNRLYLTGSGDNIFVSSEFNTADLSFSAPCLIDGASDSQYTLSAGKWIISRSQKNGDSIAALYACTAGRNSGYNLPQIGLLGTAEGIFQGYDENWKQVIVPPEIYVNTDSDTFTPSFAQSVFGTANTSGSFAQAGAFVLQLSQNQLTLATQVTTHTLHTLYSNQHWVQILMPQMQSSQKVTIHSLVQNNFYLHWMQTVVNEYQNELTWNTTLISAFSSFNEPVLTELAGGLAAVASRDGFVTIPETPLVLRETEYGAVPEFTPGISAGTSLYYGLFSHSLRMIDTQNETDSILIPDHSGIWAVSGRNLYSLINSDYDSGAAMHIWSPDIVSSHTVVLPYMPLLIWSGPEGVYYDDGNMTQIVPKATVQ